MTKRNWPEEIDWIRKQDKMLYQLINILSVAAMLFLVCFVAHRAADAGTESVMAAGTSSFLADAGLTEVIRLTVSDHQMAVADGSAQDTQLASVEPSWAVLTADLDTAGQDGQLMQEQENDYAVLPTAQINRDVNVSLVWYQDGAAEGNGCGRAEAQIDFRWKQEDAAQGALLKAECQNVRGQPAATSQRSGCQGIRGQTPPVCQV